MERRLRQGFEVDVTDVPINSKYIKQIESAGLSVILRSKWNNTVVVQCEDTTLLQRVESLPFVKKVEQVAQYLKPSDNVEKNRDSTPLPTEDVAKSDELYGAGSVNSGYLPLAQSNFPLSTITPPICNA